MFKIADVVRLKGYPDEPENYGIIYEIKSKTKYPWNIRIMFFGTSEFRTDCWGSYTERDLIRVSK